MRIARAILVSMLLASGCATTGTPGSSTAGDAPAADVAAAPSLGDLIADTKTLDQPSNAARLDAVERLLRARGLIFTSQTFPNTRLDRDPRPDGRNLIVDLPGRNDSESEIIVGAHLDAVALSGGQHSHGMIDNGAGVVVLTRIASALSQPRRRHRIRFVFFDMEENDIQGSKAFVTTLDRMRVGAMVNVDIAGYGDTVVAGPTSTAGSARLFRTFDSVCGTRGYDCLQFPTYPGSDDRSFSAAGIPSISIGVVSRIEAHQLWLMLNGGKESGLAPGFLPSILRTIHIREDSAEKLTISGMTLIYNAVLNLVSDLDATPGPLAVGN